MQNPPEGFYPDKPMQESNLKQKITKLLAPGRSATDTDYLYRIADAVRRINMGDSVYIRGIVEFSNICRNQCRYCGLRCGNQNAPRYLIPSDEILDMAIGMEQAGVSTIVLQSGEAPGFGDNDLGRLIKAIKKKTKLAVTLSVGNRPDKTYEYWRDCGMDRYLLRFETSAPKLFDWIHPDCQLGDRLRCLRDLRDLEVQVGSGFMIGLPGETLEILADNILLCRELDLDMIGIGPFIPHPVTPMGNEKNAYHDDPEMFFRALAVLRICNPLAHIPATTAYDVAFPNQGRDLALCRGANVFMPNFTPARYSKQYLLYPGKPEVDADMTVCMEAFRQRLRKLSRPLGAGPGHSLKRRINQESF